MRSHAFFCLMAVAMAANPFDNGGNWYVNPSFQAELDTSIATATGTVKTTLQSMRNIPSAWWIDVKAKIKGDDTNTVEGILKDAASKASPPLVTFIVYDVPNRDCHAVASNGEICCTYNTDGTCNYLASGDCSAGVTEYKTTYIDPLVAVFKQYQDKVPIVLVIEPDSLPNLATNLDDPRCSNTATQTAYKQGIAYAIDQFYTNVPKATLYLDAAHGGWLGWENNMASFKTLVEGMGVVSKIRGFATNVANYQPIGVQCPSYGYCMNGQNSGASCCADPCSLQSEWNYAHNEANYVLMLTKSFSGKYVIIDTGRNGVENMRSDCANWCNARGAGVGRVPSITTGINMVDAFYWLKTPGESDGCTQTLPSGDTCPRFDTFCGSTDSIGSASGEPRAPEAGQWFDYQIKMLAANANMYPNGGAPTPTPGSTSAPGVPSTPTPASSTVPRASGNPFDNGNNWYVNPSFQAELDTSIATSTGTVKTTLQSMRDIPSAWWIDVKAKIKGDDTNTVEGILKDAASKASPPLVTFIVYDVPNRDCHAKASNGEICCTYNADRTCNYLASGDCSAGVTEYKTTYIDPLVTVFKQYQDKVRIVLIIEPDSLPNLATNLDDPRCSNTATQTAYKQGIAYAIDQFYTQLPAVTLYLDAAHGGWLGWENNMASFKTLITGMGIVTKIRGFATNVANYQPIGEQCASYGYCMNGQNSGASCCADPCSLQSEWNYAHNEANYVLMLTKSFSGKYVVIDTGRNGVADMREDCANWCNARGAGVGRVPSITTGINMVDAFYWLKTPGESDGCTQTLPSGATCARFDDFCGSADSIGSASGEPRAPEAGQWFDYQIKMLAANANMYPNGTPAPVKTTPAPVKATPAPTPAPVKATPAPTPKPTPAPTPAPATTTPRPATPVPTPAPVTTHPTPVPGTCVYDACTTAADCGCSTKCYRLIAGLSLAMCLPSCSGWDCTVL